MTDDLQRRRKRTKNVKDERQETGVKVLQMKHRRSRKSKFELGKSKRVYDKKKKDKKRNQIVIIQIAQAKLMMEEIRIMFSGLREMNRQLKELIAEINSKILDKLATWDAGDN